MVPAEVDAKTKPAGLKGIGRGKAPRSTIGHANLKPKRKGRRTEAELAAVILKPGAPGRAAKVMRAKKAIVKQQRRLKRYCISSIILYHEDDKLDITEHGEYSEHHLLEAIWHDPDTQKVKRIKAGELHQLNGTAQRAKPKGPTNKDLRTEARTAWAELVEAKIVSLFSALISPNNVAFVLLDSNCN